MQAGSAERPRIRSPSAGHISGRDLRARALADRRGLDALPLAPAHYEREHEPLLQSHPQIGDHDLAVPEAPGH